MGLKGIEKEKMKELKKGKYSAGIYARLSVDHTIKRESITSQIAIAKKYLAQQEDISLYRCYTDLGESGTNFKRAGFLQLMEDIRAKKVNCVIVKDFSRLGRNYLETGAYIDKIFPFLGVRFISIADEFDSCSQKGALLDRNLKNLINELYVYDTAQKVKEVKKFYQKQGNYMGGYAPYGYQIKIQEGKRILVLDSNAFEIVKKILQLTLEGKSQRDIITWLYQNRVYRPSDYRRTGSIYCIEGEPLLAWQRGSIQQIISRLGIEKGMDSLSVKEKKGKAEQKERIKKQKEQDRWKGYLYCGDCKKELSVRRDGKQAIFFCCRAKRIDALQCKKKQISEEVLSSCIILLLEKILKNQNIIFENKIKELKKHNKSKYLNRKEKEIKKIENQILSVKRMISESYKDYQRGTIEEEPFFIKKLEETEKIKNLENQRNIKVQEKETDIFQLQNQFDKLEYFNFAIKRIELFEKNRIVFQLYIRR